MRQLLVISIGPVQDFIASARRTRDLWFGSHLLSELSKAAARGLDDHGAKLVMPAIDPSRFDDDDQYLERRADPIDEDTGEVARSVSNKLVAVLPEGDGSEAAERARESIRQTWHSFADNVKRKCQDIIANRRDGKVWNEQINSLLEYYAMWKNFPEGADYRQTRKDLEAELAGRKNLREFDSWDVAGGWYAKQVEDSPRRKGLLPKSSLGGARLTVLTRDAHQTRTGKRLRIASEESLDAVGLIKRAGGRPNQFIPLMNIAAAHWIERVREERPDDFETICSSLKGLYGKLDFEQLQSRDLDWVDSFPYDAQLLREERWDGIFEDELGWKTLMHGYDWMREAQETVLPALKSMGGPPTPYVACLVADGDRMGAATDRLEDWNSHFDFSRKLSDFSDRVRTIVEDKHRGILVYAGGDDVLAFVCLRDAMSCAKKLAETFTEAMEDEVSGVEPSLSVGVGIGHTLDGMGHLLELGRRAETFAKAKNLEEKGLDRNALGVVLDKRSGGIDQWRSRWDDWNDLGPVGRVRRDLQILDANGLPSTKIYEVEETFRRFPQPDEVSSDDDAEFALTLRSDTVRTLERGQLGSDKEAELATIDALGLQLDEGDDYATTYRKIDRWTSRLIIARNLAQFSDWSDITASAHLADDAHADAKQQGAQ